MKVRISSPQDTCVVNSEYVHVEVATHESAEALKTALKSATQLASQNSIRKIEVYIPHNCQEKFKSTLEYFGFSLILVDLELISKKVFVGNVSNEFTWKINEVEPTQLHELLRQQADYHYSFFPDYYLPSSMIDWQLYNEELSSNLKDSQYIQIVVENSLLPIGFLYASYSSEELVIFDIVVDEKHRGKGIGTQLIAYLIRHYETKKISVMTLSNSPSHSWYKKMGFSEVSSVYFKVINE